MLALSVVCAIAWGCDSAPLPAASSLDCRLGNFTSPELAVLCLSEARQISDGDREAALRQLATDSALEDSLQVAGQYDKMGDVTRALGRIGDFYARGLFPDSVRFHRMMDHLAITTDYVRGLVPNVGGRTAPTATPYLVWHPYAGLGLFFQPVETTQLVVYVLPRDDIPLDSLLQIAQHLYAYAVWRSYGGLRYPVWEYEFDFASGGVTAYAPWVSGLAETTAMMVFAEAYRRTGDVVWLNRARETLNSLRVPWDKGGVLLPDTTHGYWWEEFHPVVQIWNGGAEALAGVAFLYNVTGDTAVKTMYDKGLAALKYYTPSYDTGTWTLYSRTQGYNSTFYHGLSIQRLDGLYSLTGDPWFKSVADRWRTYTPPPGIQ